MCFRHTSRWFKSHQFGRSHINPMAQRAGRINWAKITFKQQNPHGTPAFRERFYVKNEANIAHADASTNVFSIHVFIGHMKESPWHRTSMDFHFLSGANTNPQVLVTGTIIMPTVLNHESHWHTVFHIPLKLIVTDVERPCRTSFSSSFLSVAMRLCVRVKRCA